MSETTATPPGQKADPVRAWRHWEEYARTHDVSHLHGKAVGVDPESGEVFFGDTSTDIYNQLRSQGRRPILVYWRVGSRYYGKLRGGLRCSPVA